MGTSQDWYTDRLLAQFRAEDSFTFGDVSDRFTDFLARLRYSADRTFYLHRLVDRLADGDRLYAVTQEKNFREEVEEKRKLLGNRSGYAYSNQ